MQRCKQMSDIANHGVQYQSESSAGKTYQVFAFRLNEIDTCTCIAFVMNRNKEAKRLGLKEKGISAAGLASDCKHLQEVRRVTCQWTQKSEDEYRYDGTCPKCGGPVVEEGKAMIPGGIGHDADHVDDLRAMLAELKGGSDAEMEEIAAEVTADAIEAEQQAEAAEVDAMIEAAEDVVGTVEAPPVNRQHGTIPTDPGEWIEDLIRSRNGVIPTGDDWKQLRELWGPVYGKRNIDAAYKAACTPDAALARMVSQPAVTFEHPEVIPVLQASDDPTDAAFGNLAAAIQAHVVKPVNDTSNFNAMLAVPAGDDTEEPTAVQIEDEDGADGTDDALLDDNDDVRPEFFGEMVSLDTVMECVDEVLGEYLGGTFAGQASKRIEEMLQARIGGSGTVATVTPIREPGPHAAAKRLASKIRPS